jgi:hypothetical protein
LGASAPTGDNGFDEMRETSPITWLLRVLAPILDRVGTTLHRKTVGSKKIRKAGTCPFLTLLSSE